MHSSTAHVLVRGEKTIQQQFLELFVRGDGCLKFERAIAAASSRHVFEPTILGRTSSNGRPGQPIQGHIVGLPHKTQNAFYFVLEA